MTALSELARLGSATVYEAGGRGGFVDAPLHALVPGARVAGPARTVLCGQDDNLMVHAAMPNLQPGEILVMTMPEPAAVALFGGLLATQARARGAAGVLVDASVRDVLVLDADGAAVVEAERVDEVLAAALEREQKERVKAQKLASGLHSYDIDGLRAVVEGGGR